MKKAVSELSKVVSNLVKKTTLNMNPSGGAAVKITEGQATIHFPNKEAVFYNPVQEFNRDLSISVIQLYLDEMKDHVKFVPDKVRLLEAFSASGLRSIRYAKELTGLPLEIIANDISEKAVESIKSNVKSNDVTDIVIPSQNDACMAMYTRRKWDDRFHVIDLDPYGSPTPFLDATVQSSHDGALLCITCTDMAVLCGNAAETCYTKYGSVSLKSKACHEMALRIILQCIESHANRYGRYIEPLVSLSIDFYARVFVTIHSGQKQCKQTTSKLGNVYQCTGCESIHVQPLGRIERHPDGKNMKYKIPTGPPVGPKCDVCQHPFHLGGPFWLAPIHNQDFLDKLLDSIEEEKFKTFERMKGMLSVAAEELQDVPFYYCHDRLCAMVKAESGKILHFRSALLNAGYRVSLSHACKHALKTDAPLDFIWDMMRCWEKQHSHSKAKLPPESVARRITDVESKHQVSFELHPEANPTSRALQLRRFQVNPERNWGPKSKAAKGTFEDDAKRIRNQGKKRRKQQDEPSSPSGSDQVSTRKCIKA